MLSFVPRSRPARRRRAAIGHRVKLESGMQGQRQRSQLGAGIECWDVGRVWSGLQGGCEENTSVMDHEYIRGVVGERIWKIRAARVLLGG